MSLRLCCVVAHPDDECFGFGGALAEAAERGITTSVLCLTDGQAGSHRGTARDGAELGAMRRQEFAASCEILGVQQHELLALQDGQLEFESLHDLGCLLVKRFRSFRPHVVLTFGGEGAPNSHPDHTTVSAAATAAFHWSGNAKRFPDEGAPWCPQRLYYLTTNFFLPGRPAPLPAPWTTVLDIRAFQQRKQDAFAAHRSQAPLMEQTRALFAEHGGEERYLLAYAEGLRPAAQGTDLFEGVSER